MIREAEFVELFGNTVKKSASRQFSKNCPIHDFIWHSLFTLVYLYCKDGREEGTTLGSCSHSLSPSWALVILAENCRSSSVTLWTVTHQALLSMGSSRQEYWSGLPCPPPGESSRPRGWIHVSCGSCIAGRFFTAEPPGKHLMYSDDDQFEEEMLLPNHWLLKEAASFFCVLTLVTGWTRRCFPFLLVELLSHPSLLRFKTL